MPARKAGGLYKTCHRTYMTVLQILSVPLTVNGVLRDGEGTLSFKLSPHILARFLDTF